MAEFIGGTIILIAIVGVMMVCLCKKPEIKDPILDEMFSKISKLPDDKIAHIKKQVDDYAS